MTTDATEIIAVDIGGTHARFARAALRAGEPPQLSDVVTFKTEDFSGVQAVWAAYRDSRTETLPRSAAIAVAVPLGADVVRFTNSPWTFRPATLADELGLDRLTLLNDFGAMAHAVAWLDGSLERIAGPDELLPADGVVSVIGLGTGLGVAMLFRRDGQTYAIEAEGGHIDFAALDDLETRILDQLRLRFGRVSSERVVSGPGLGNIYRALVAIEGGGVRPMDDGDIWDSAISGDDPMASAALQRLMLSFGSVAGDLALAHGAKAVVLVGGLVNRIADQLRGPGFAERFVAKGRYASRMQSIPVRLATHPEPGLFGAAAAFKSEHLAG